MLVPMAIAAALLAAGEARVRVPRPAPEQVPQQENLSDDQIRAQIDTYLGAIDTPVSIARWRSLGPRAAPFLAEIAASDKELPSRRAKAVDGLSAVGGDQAKSAVARLSRGEREPLVVRLSAVRGMARLERGQRLSAALRPVLEGAKDARVRAQAADSLAERAPRAACAAVQAQAGKEDEQARVHYRKALERCGPSSAAPAEQPPDPAR